MVLRIIYPAGILGRVKMTDTKYWSPDKYVRLLRMLLGEADRYVTYPYVAVRLKNNEPDKMSCL